MEQEIKLNAHNLAKDESKASPACFAEAPQGHELNAHNKQEYPPMHATGINTSLIMLLVLMTGLLALCGCATREADTTIEQSQDTVIVDDNRQATIDNLEYQAICDANREYYNKVTSFDQKIIRGESVSSDDAFDLLPKTDDEVHVLWGYNADYADRGARHDSVCFHNVMEQPSIDKICKYYVAMGCSDGYIAECYDYRCYELWKKYPKETQEALSALSYTKRDVESTLARFKENFD